MAHKVSPLRFAYDALEPYIDAETMELHHDTHHQTYVDNLNTAIEPYPHLADLTTEDLLRRLDQVPEEIQTAVRNHGGGHVNHELYWEILGPKAGESPKGAIADAITTHFGSFPRFQSLFTDAATKHFGSGWAFLVVNPATEGLEIMSLPNQDSVLLQGKLAVLCCDVWEHAYYLKYRNRRQDYLLAWWNVVAWDAVDQRLEDVRAGQTRDVRARAAEGMRAVDEKMGQALDSGGHSLRRAEGFLRDTKAHVSEALRAGQEAIRPAPTTREA